MNILTDDVIITWGIIIIVTIGSIVGVSLYRKLKK